MAKISSQIRLLSKRWDNGQGWPKRLEWLEVNGIRGWTGQRIDFSYPITAIVGENGSGKSTILQAAAAVYLGEDGAEPWFASEFFPDTAWDQVRDARIGFGYREGTNRKEGSVRKPTTRWLGNQERPKRHVTYIDLSRIQPVSARVGYLKIAKSRHTEASARAFEKDWQNDFAFTFTTPQAVLLLLCWAIAALIAGWIAAKVAKHRWAVWALAALITLYLASLHLVMFWFTFPWWYNLAVVIPATPAALLGARLARKS